MYQSFMGGVTLGVTLGLAVGAFAGLGIAALCQINKRPRIEALEKVADAAECYRQRRSYGDSEECYKYLEDSLRTLRQLEED